MADSQSRTGREPEAVPARMALAVSGFGGFAYDTANGDLIIWLKDASRAPAARDLVAQYLATIPGRGGRAGRNPPVRIETADFDFLELGGLRDRMNAALETEPGVHWVGISQLTNRVEVGVDAGAAARIAVLLDRAGVPARARHFELVQPVFDESFDPNDPNTFPPEVDPAPVAEGSGAPQYLNSRANEIAGGLYMTFLAPSGSVPVNYLVEYSCTVGAIVNDASNNLRMLTASHCSNGMGQVTGNGYWQPHINNYDKTKLVSDISFAFEDLDPGFKSALPSYIAYKWADALLASKDPRSQQAFDFGHIYRPVSIRADWILPPANPQWQINATNPKFHIVGAGALGPVGEVLEKVGARSGWTIGPTVSTCEDIVYVQGTIRKTIRCQLRTSIPVYPGDSGGSLFRTLPGNDGSLVEFMGIVDSYLPDQHASWFSPWGKIVQELGPLTVAP